MAGNCSNLVPPLRVVVHRKCNSTQPRSWKPGDQAPGASGRARNCQTVVSGQKKCRHCGVKKSYAAALSTTKVQSRSGWTQPKPNSSSQVSAAATSGGTTKICMWKRSSTSKPKSGRAYCRVFWVRRGHTANQASGESSQQSGHG